MGRKSTFSQLPEEITARFHELLRSDKYTQEQMRDYLNDYLNELGEQPVITRDIVQKQAKNYKERLIAISEDRRREKEIINGIMAATGMKPDAEQAQLTSILLQSIISKVTIEMSDSEELPDIDNIKKLAWTHKIVNESNRVIEQSVKQAEERLAKEMAAAMKANGVDAETIRVVERAIVKVTDTNG
jgi:hypothetical protein